jgi:hypothetical protein
MRKPRRKIAGLKVLAPEDDLFVFPITFFPEPFLLKSTLPEKSNYGQKPFTALKNITAMPTRAPAISTVLGWM